MAGATDILEAQVYLQQDKTAQRIFRFILRQQAANGWNIAKELDQDTEETKRTLNKLRDLGVLEGDGSGLEGFYHSTSLGYALSESTS
jgi:predicted transcriptional regulator